MKSNRQRTIDDCKLLYIVYSYNTCNCTSIILNTEIIYYISLGIWYMIKIGMILFIISFFLVYSILIG